MEDRRVFARMDAKFPLKFLDPRNGMEGKGNTVNISANGIGLESAENFPADTPLEIWLEIPDQHEPFYTRGEIVWCKCQDNACSCMGIHLEKAELMGLARVLWLKKQN